MDPVDVMRRYKERIAYLHLKDLTPDEPDAEVFPILSGNEAMPIFCELGLGPIDFSRVIQFLKEIQYDGWVTVEIDKSTSTPMNSLTICRDYVQSRLGLSISA